MKKVFISGPYSSDPEGNTEKAIAVGSEIIKLGHCPFIPHLSHFVELRHHVPYETWMDTGQALTRFFKRDSTQANNLTLYPHMEKEFWLWISSWAIFLQKPSDLGYSDDDLFVAFSYEI